MVFSGFARAITWLGDSFNSTPLRSPQGIPHYNEQPSKMKYILPASLIALATGVNNTQAEQRYCTGSNENSQSGAMQSFSVFENATVSFPHFVSLYQVSKR
jgi:hypothetical protein